MMARYDELSALKLFIEEQQHWLDSVLETLGWNKESLEQVSYNVNFELTHVVHQ
jgi:hypothetical protein